MLIFPVLLSLILMKISIKNSVLLWLGKNSFAIYILQRIPMIILSELGLSDYNKYLFAGTVFAITILISWGYTKLIGKFDRKLFPDRTKAL